METSSGICYVLFDQCTNSYKIDLAQGRKTRCRKIKEEEIKIRHNRFAFTSNRKHKGVYYLKEWNTTVFRESKVRGSYWSRGKRYTHPSRRGSSGGGRGSVFPSVLDIVVGGYQRLESDRTF